MRFLHTLIMFVLSTSAIAGPDQTAIEIEVAAVERAFAKTMADRDFTAFAAFIDDEAIFLAGPDAARGKTAVLERWKTYFEDQQAPFSWKPETVAVLESGKLALSTGPVFNSDGDLTAYFTSTWRKMDSGAWRVVFDKGNKACPGDKQ